IRSRTRRCRRHHRLPRLLLRLRRTLKEVLVTHHRILQVRKLWCIMLTRIVGKGLPSRRR
ncbi:MAG: hypothetical protein WCS37_09915, partial [Chloroflexota bacterium]